MMYIAFGFFFSILAYHEIEWIYTTFKWKIPSKMYLRNTSHGRNRQSSHRGIFLKWLFITIISILSFHLENNNWRIWTKETIAHQYKLTANNPTQTKLTFNDNFIIFVVFSSKSMKNKEKLIYRNLQQYRI